MKLNPEQQRAVDHIEGPSMVNAGPGTGKTQMFAARAINIVENADIDPHNILGLTFSNAGQVAMKKRLVKMAGPMGYRFHVYTFHSLANKVLKENPDLIGVRDIEAAMEIDRILIIRQIIDSLDSESPLRRKSGNMYYWEKAMLDLYSKMKTEYWNLDTVENAATTFLKSLEDHPDYTYKRSGKGYQKGDLKLAAIKAEEEKMEKLVEAAKYFNVYNQKLREKGLYDYDDMLLIVTEAFDRNTWLLRRYQEQYLYIQVDEFQDTNGVQMKLLNQLSKYWGDQANVFVVGDDDQALYEFQGARIKNMVDFKESYPDILLTTLTKNYRSRQAILDVAKNVIEHNEDRLVNKLGIQKEYVAMNDSASRSAPIKVIEFESIAEQLAWLVHQLKSKKDLSEYAIIYSKHKQSEELIRLLVNNRIPYNSQRTINALGTSTWRMVFSMMNIAYSNNPDKKDGYIYDLAAYHFIPGYDKRIFHKIVTERPNDNYARSAYDIACDIPEFKAFLDKIRTAAAELTLHDCLDVIVFESGIGSYCKEDTKKMQELISVMKYVKAFSLENPYAKYEHLKQHIKAMVDNNIIIPVEIIVKDKNGVNLMSSHASKGLEFDKVFMLDCTETWHPSANWTGRFSLPDTLLHSKADTTEEAARRAFFVAITRARKECMMLYSLNDGKKETMPAIFLSETGLPVTKAKKYGYVEQYYSNYFENNTQITSLLEGFDLQEKVDNFVWSVSALNTYLESPWTFFCKYILKIPENEPHIFTFGTVVHEVLFDYIMAMRRSVKDGGQEFTQQAEQRKFMPLDEVQLLFVDKMNKFRSHFTATEFDGYMSRGTDIFNNYIPNQDFTVFSRAEQSFRNIEIDGIPVKCMIDRMDFSKETDFVTIDYKTGKYKYQKFQKITGDLWRQAVFYKLCIQAHSIKESWYCNEFQFHFLEDDKKPLIVLNPEKEDMDIVKQQLMEADQKIKNLEIFEPGEVENKYTLMLKN